MTVLMLNNAEYHAFAQFTFSGTTYSVGTQTELRGGVWYDGVLKTAPQLEMDFGTPLSLSQAANIDLEIGDGAGGIYRNLTDANVLDGTQVTITLVERSHWNDGSTTEATYAQTLTIVGTSLQPSGVIFHLQDLEDQKLATLYPTNTWKADDWSGLTSDDAGKPICEPVGTAIKFACALLQSNTTNDSYWYGVCTGTPKLYPVVAVSTASPNNFRITGDITSLLVVGATFLVAGSTANDGLYTIAAGSIFTGGQTRINTVETIVSSTANGNVYLVPSVLTVYRNRRIVSSSEYTQQIGYPFVTVLNGDFSLGSADWTAQTGGTGTVSFAGGVCTLTSTNSSNFGQIQYAASTSGGVGIKGAYYALQITTGAGTAIEARADSGTFYVCPANATTTIFVKTIQVGTAAFTIRVQNHTGTSIIKKVRVVPLNLRLLLFTTPQIDFNGTPYVIEADVLGVESRDACTEVQRLLGLAGCTTDATTFNNAIAQTYAKSVDCDYGRGGQRKISAILDDLLFVARAGLSRTSSGSYSIWLDAAGSPSITLDESAADVVNVSKFDKPGKPSTVGLNCSPSSADPSTMQVQITRAVANGVLGPDNPREIRYLRDPTTMDSLLCYRALRAQYNGIATATVYRVQANIGDIVALTSPRNWAGQRIFTVWSTQRVPKGNKLQLMEYNAAVYTYTAGTLPTIAAAGYQPDYSATPPAAPTTVKVLATGTSTDGAGTTTAYVEVSAIPPQVNWQTLWFAAIHNVAGTVTLAAATFTAGVYKATISGLRQGEVYKLQCYATAGTLQGSIQSTFDATAIGGSSSATTFTCAGTIQVPATVASCTAQQTMGSYIKVSWPAVTSPNLQGYALERNVGAGFTQIWQGNALVFQEGNVGYSTSYTYRVRALDIYGNFSAAYATSSTVSPTGNIVGGVSGVGDISTNTVASVNRNGVTTASGSWNNTPGGGFGYEKSHNFGVTHSLGKTPIVGGVISGNVAFVAGCNSRDSSGATITIDVMPGMNISFTSTGALSGPAAYSSLAMGAYSGTASVDVW